MLYKHLCPYQAYAVSPQNINNVFGYQRAYWDLISSFDEVHGEFRGSMRNFLINRVFDKAPELSKDLDRKSTRLNSSHSAKSRMPSSA